MNNNTCPHCGKHIASGYEMSNRTLLHQIEVRLGQYGYPGHTTPEKYRAACAVRNVIKLHAPELPSKNRAIPYHIYTVALNALNQILPEKEHLGDAEEEPTT